MYAFNFNAEKNRKLKSDRGVSFELVINAIDEGRLLDVIPHPAYNKYPEQEMYVINTNNYVYLVPYVRDEKKKEIFLKTIYPSRKMTKYYLDKKE